MKSLISRIITQSGVEPMYNGKTNKLYTESQVYEIAEKIAKAWHKTEEI